jgi:hypothetical protein
MRRNFAMGTFLAVLAFAGAAQLSAQNSAPGDWQKFLDSNGVTVYDSVNNVVWLADFNLAAQIVPDAMPPDDNFRFGLKLCNVSNPSPADPCVNKSGTMNYTSAVAWVAAMNGYDGGNGYLGHHDWQLPTTPKRESDCTEFGKKHFKNSFGFDCDENALGYLYYDALGFTAPDTAVPIPPNTVGPFSNFQPGLYWGGQLGDGANGGLAVFSFANGAQGGSTRSDYLYVLPMIIGELNGLPLPAGSTTLYVNLGGQTVYDPETEVTWLADANLAATWIEDPNLGTVDTLGLPLCETPAKPSPCVALDGSMDYASAQQFIINMNAYDNGAGNPRGYLGQTNWQLPPVDASCPTYGCGGTLNPMGNLYYNQLSYHGQLGFPAGTPVVEAPDIAVGPFNHVQPSQYWSCVADLIRDACEIGGEAGTGKAQFGFSFGDGFLGTTGEPADHFVTVYYVLQTPTKPPIPPKCPPTDSSCYQ